RVTHANRAREVPLPEPRHLYGARLVLDAHQKVVAPGAPSLARRRDLADHRGELARHELLHAAHAARVQILARHMAQEILDAPDAELGEELGPPRPHAR